MYTNMYVAQWPTYICMHTHGPILGLRPLWAMSLKYACVPICVCHLLGYHISIYTYASIVCVVIGRSVYTDPRENHRSYTQTAVGGRSAYHGLAATTCVWRPSAPPLLHPFTAKLFGEPCALSENLASHLLCGPVRSNLWWLRKSDHLIGYLHYLPLIVCNQPLQWRVCCSDWWPSAFCIETVMFLPNWIESFPKVQI